MTTARQPIRYQGDILSYSKQKKPANVLAGFLN